MVLNATRFLSSLIANMATILIYFQQKFTLFRSFEHLAIKFLNQKRFLARLKSASKSSLRWPGKYDVFYSSNISQSIQATWRAKMTLPSSQELQMYTV